MMQVSCPMNALYTEMYVTVTAKPGVGSGVTGACFLHKFVRRLSAAPVT